MSVRLDDEELDILMGHESSRISHAARLTYILGIRPYMDYATGLVGYRRKVSYQSLKELLEQAPVRGSHRESVQPSKEAIRNILRELERIGLIRWEKSQERGLFFECLQAHRDSSPKNMNNPRTTPRSNPRSNPSQPIYGAGFAGDEQPDEHGLLIAMNNPPPVSGNTNTPPNAHARASDYPQSVDNSGRPACIPADLWAQYAQERNLRTGRALSITQTLTLWQELAGMDLDGYDVALVLKRCIGYGFTTFDRRPETQKKPPAATNQNPGAFTSTLKPKRGDYAAIQDTDTSAVAKTHRATEQWLHERGFPDAGGTAFGVVLEGQFRREAL